MNDCKHCGRKTTGVLAKDSESDEYFFVPSLCSRCIMVLSDEVDGKPNGAGGFTCKACKAKVWALRNGECVDCYAEACEAVDALPEVEPIEPPFGYNLLGCDDIMAAIEVERAYVLTPTIDDLEN